MREQLQKRLDELKAEFDTGQRMMQELETRQAKLRDQLLRLAGAITVLETLAASEPPAGGPAAGPAGGDQS